MKRANKLQSREGLLLQISRNNQNREYIKKMLMESID